ncbi:MAG: hypothetical protein L0Y68_05385 [Candidatus Dadabacteria bacterium]|nr:hypothetical protein [Candidatus Dadabacteria bacterium]
MKSRSLARCIWQKIIVVTLNILLFALPLGGFAQEVAPTNNITPQEQRLEELEKQLKELKEEIQRMKKEEEAKPKTVEEAPPPEVEKKDGKGVFEYLADRVKIGGYGSFRYEYLTAGGEDLNTFTLRRLVLTTDVRPVDRISIYTELEFERFLQIEVEEGTSSNDGGLTFEQEIESSNESEIALEQAWLQFDYAENHGLRLGAILVPLGRFNLYHDDNLYDFNRRTITDRQGPVLPVAAAWDELGAGLNGYFDLGDRGGLSYQFYIMNGATLEGQIETVIETTPDESKLELEAKLDLSPGSFSTDLNGAKAYTGRIAYSPFLGAEIGGSFYVGQYTPDFLGINKYIAAFGGDTKFSIGPFDIEAEYIYTHFQDAEEVVERFSELTVNSEVEGEVDDLIIELAFESPMIAKNKQGFWLSLTYHFWPEFLNKTPLGSPFENPDLRLVGRYEIVSFDDLFTEVEFEDGVVTDIETKDITQQLITLGLSYRPIPTIGVIFNFEIGDLLEGDELIFPEGVEADKFFGFTAGAVFGF